MKKPLTVTVLFLVAIWGLTSATAGTLLRDGDFVAVCGDSITEQRLYALFIEDYLLMCKPAADLRVSPFGWNGDSTEWFSKCFRSSGVRCS
jgi:hypothetical protein